MGGSSCADVLMSCDVDGADETVRRCAALDGEWDGEADARRRRHSGWQEQTTELDQRSFAWTVRSLNFITPFN